MLIRGTTRLLGVLGNPVAHSYSPAMHNAAIEKLGLDLVYVPLQVEIKNLGDCIRGLKAMRFLGANVTIPFKEAVIPFLDELSQSSLAMRAVNTIVVRKDGTLFGDSTDPEGFMAGFVEAGNTFDGKSVGVLGNGGSARTIGFSLLLKGRPTRITFIARDAEKSAALILELREFQTKFRMTGCKLEAIPFSNYPDRRHEFDVIVNTTPVGMYPKTEESILPPEWLEPVQIVYDIVYNPEETLLLRSARAKGCRTVGGLAMLVQQGVASFKLWTGSEADPAFFYEGIRRQQNQNRSEALP